MSVPAVMNTRLLDRYVLPKVALTFITIASLAGVYLTMTTHGAPPGWALVRWVHLAALGVLAGGTLWWGFFLRCPPEPDAQPPVARLVLAEGRRFRGIAVPAVALALLTAPHLSWFRGWSVTSPSRLLTAGSGLALAVALAASLHALLRGSDPSRPFATGRARRAFFALAVAFGSSGALDASLTFPGQPWTWALRSVHLTAFGLWFGGAIWNIFIAVPAARETLAFPVVVAAAEQLERFRWTVRVILPTLALTGFLQALPYRGWQAAVLTGTLAGRLILFKFVLLIGLVAVFITCPLWRACSPIRGMCDLEELPASRAEPAHRIDNRGKACAGFVRIREALEAMRPGEHLELLSSDPISWWELPAWLEKHGHRLLEQERRGRLWWRSFRFLIAKAPEGAAEAAGRQRATREEGYPEPVQAPSASTSPGRRG